MLVFGSHHLLPVGFSRLAARDDKVKCHLTRTNILASLIPTLASDAQGSWDPSELSLSIAVVEATAGRGLGKHLLQRKWMAVEGMSLQMR